MLSQASFDFEEYLGTVRKAMPLHLKSTLDMPISESSEIYKINEEEEAKESGEITQHNYRTISGMSGMGS